MGACTRAQSAGFIVVLIAQCPSLLQRIPKPFELPSGLFSRRAHRPIVNQLAKSNCRDVTSVRGGGKKSIQFVQTGQVDDLENTFDSSLWLVGKSPTAVKIKNRAEWTSE